MVTNPHLEWRIKGSGLYIGGYVVQCTKVYWFTWKTVSKAGTKEQAVKDLEFFKEYYTA